MTILQRIIYYLICFYDGCDTPFEKYSDYVLFNEIFKSGNWGVTGHG